MLLWNYLILDATTENAPLLLINIYCPNLKTAKFYASFMDKIVDCLNTQYIIKGGDLNNGQRFRLDEF